MKNGLGAVKAGETVTTILVVDDESTNMSVLTHLLGPDYHVSAVNYGENASRAATSDQRLDPVCLTS